MYTKHLVLFLLLQLILTSCSEQSIQFKQNSKGFPYSIIVPEDVTIDGGMFLSAAGKYDNGLNPSGIMTEVALHYKAWAETITVRIDTHKINEFKQNFDLDPFQSHTWSVVADQQHGIPTISKSMPGMQELDITSHSMNGYISKTGTISWSVPQQGSETEAAIIISKFTIGVNDTTGLRIIPTDDDGSHTFSASDFNQIEVDEQARISIIRFKTSIEEIDGKYYLFTTMYTNNIILIVQQ